MFEKFRATAKNTFFYSASNFAGKLSGIVLIPLYTANLSVEMFGLFALFEVVFQFIQASTGLGLLGSLQRWYWDKDYRAQQKEIVFTVFSTYFIINIGVALGLYACFNLLADYVFQVEIAQELRLVFLASTFIRLLVELLFLLMRIQYKALPHTIYQLIQLVLFVGGVSYLLAIHDLKVEGIFAAYGISYSIVFLLLIPYLLKNIVWKYRTDLLKEMLSFGLPLAISNVINLLLGVSDKIIINLFSTLKNVGNYTLAFKISNIVQLMVLNAFMNSYTHVYYKGMNDADSTRFFSRSMTYLVLFLCLLSMGLVLFIDDVVKILTLNNADYIDSIVIIPVLTLGLIFGGIRSMLTLPLSKYKKTTIISLISIGMGVVNVLLNVLMVPEWGSMGAAISTLVVQFLSVFLFYNQANKLETHLMDVRRIVIIITLTLVLGSANYWPIHFHWLLMLPLKIAILGVWVAALFVFRVFDDVELVRIQQGWDKWKHPTNLLQNLKGLKNTPNE